MSPLDRQPESSLEVEIDRRLKALPDRRAPRTLVPRVMAALQARAGLPWYQRTWWQWPLAAQVPAILVVCACLAGIAWLAVHGVQGDLTASLGSKLTAWLDPLAPLWNLLKTLAGAAAIVLQRTSTLTWLLMTGFAAAMYLSCVGVGTALYRIALPRRNP